MGLIFGVNAELSAPFPPFDRHRQLRIAIHGAKQFMCHLLALALLIPGCATTSSATSTKEVVHPSTPCEIPAKVETLHTDASIGCLSRIAFGSCCHQDMPQDIWRSIVASEPDLFIFLGDNVYADTEDMAMLKADYDKLGSVPAFHDLRETCPILATWDDHDYGANDAGAEYPKKKESQQVMLEFFEEPAISPRWNREGVYGAQVFGGEGRRVQVILLDTRYFRSPVKRKYEHDPLAKIRPGRCVPNTDPGATILGEAQWKWLREQLCVPAELRIIASSIQVVPEDQEYEKWSNFPRERDRLFNMVRETKANGVLVISGDRHAAEVSRIDNAVGYPLFDITSSSLNRPSAPRNEPNRHRVKYETLDTPYFDSNFGLLTIDWSAKDPVVSMQIRDTGGKIVMRHEFPLSTLRRPA